MRTIKNDVTKNEANKEILKLRKQIDYWKEQARPMKLGSGSYIFQNLTKEIPEAASRSASASSRCGRWPA